MLKIEVPGWLSANLKSGLVIPFHAMVFACSLWGIWLNKNAEVLSNKNEHVLGVVTKIQASVSTCMSAFQLFDASLVKQIRWVCWVPPKLGVIKLNVDGSSLENPGRTGFGGAFRDHISSRKLGFCGYLREGTNLVAELLAIFNGLKLAWQEDWKFLICESDFLEAVDLVFSADITFHSLAPVINDIRCLLNQDWHVEPRHVLREANKIADFLAKLGANNHHPVEGH